MEAQLQLAPWDRSTALNIPKEFLQKLNITNQSTVKIKFSENNDLIVTPVYPHKTIDERFRDWNGGAYTLTDEDRAWLNAESVGAEI